MKKTKSRSDKYVFFDLETTGFSPYNGDRVVEIGAVAWHGKKFIGEFDSLVQIDKRIPERATQIHGITNHMLIGKPRPEEIFPAFFGFIEDSILVSHNVEFDLRFLRYEFEQIGLTLNHKFQCTVDLSRRKLRRLNDYKLETVVKHLFPDACNQSHRALDDAKMVARIWIELVR